MKNNSLQKLNTNIEQLLQQDEKPLSLPEACEFCNISLSHMYKLTCSNKITFFKPAGKKIYFKKSDLNEYIFRNRKASDAELDQRATDYVVQGA